MASIYPNPCEISKYQGLYYADSEEMVLKEYWVSGKRVGFTRDEGMEILKDMARSYISWHHTHLQTTQEEIKVLNKRFYKKLWAKPITEEEYNEALKEKMESLEWSSK